MNLSKNLIYETLPTPGKPSWFPSRLCLNTRVRVNLVANVPNQAFKMQILSVKLKKFKVKFWLIKVFFATKCLIKVDFWVWNILINLYTKSGQLAFQDCIQSPAQNVLLLMAAWYNVTARVRISLLGLLTLRSHSRYLEPVVYTALPLCHSKH